MLTQDDIIKALEKADSIYPHVDGLIEYLSADDYIINVSDDPHPHANRVSCANLNESNADETIKSIIAKYSEQQLNFMWSIGPNSRPTNLEDYLISHRFKQFNHSYGLYLDNLEMQTIELPEIKIKELPITADSPTIPTMAEGFGIPLESSAKSHRTFARLKDHLTLKTYAAFGPGRDEPIGCAFTAYYKEWPVALLSGGCTQKDFRGKGIYTAFLRQRINDAIDDGIKAVVVIANVETSAPICSKFGFKKACELKYYSYMI